MAATFTTVLPPPQALDDLDAWGQLDALPWPLDATVWNTAGIYALTATEAGRSGGALTAGRRLHLSATGAAVSSGSLTGGLVQRFSVTGAAGSGGSLRILRCFPVTLSQEGGASGNVPVRLIRLRVLEGRGRADSGEALIPLRIILAMLEGHAAAGGVIRPGYKGWQWTPLPSTTDGLWVALPSTTDEDLWTALHVSPPGGPGADFDDIWQKVVQWQ